MNQMEHYRFTMLGLEEQILSVWIIGRVGCDGVEETRQELHQTVGDPSRGSSAVNAQQRGMVNPNKGLNNEFNC